MRRGNLVVMLRTTPFALRFGACPVCGPDLVGCGGKSGGRDGIARLRESKMIELKFLKLEGLRGPSNTPRHIGDIPIYNYSFADQPIVWSGYGSLPVVPRGKADAKQQGRFHLYADRQGSRRDNYSASNGMDNGPEIYGSPHARTRHRRSLRTARDGALTRGARTGGESALHPRSRSGVRHRGFAPRRADCANGGG